MKGEKVQSFKKREFYEFAANNSETLKVAIEEDGDITFSPNSVTWDVAEDEERTLSPSAARQLGHLLIGLCGGE